MFRPRPTATALAVMTLFAYAPVFAADICGDVNESSSVLTSDALLVLKKAVGQPVTLTCPAIDDLAACLAGTCGNDVAEGGEPCDGADLHGKTCATETPDTPYGTLACDKECGSFDTTACSGRFDASGDTIVDYVTGLEWEKKTGTVGNDQYCNASGDCSDVHGVNNMYLWSSSGDAPNGNAFMKFLATLNGAYDGVCYAGHCNWRLPTREEMQGIRDQDVASCQSGGICLDAAFLPSAAAQYWTSTTWDEDALLAWPIHTGISTAGPSDKPYNAFRVRAVRVAH